jgi:sigma-B regulation protein RsbU (phosphoserine phosphatase)
LELSESSIGFQKYFQLKEIEFQAVLDITVAINQNRPETGFYLLLENYLLEKLGIGHFSLFIREDDWKNPFSYGKVLQNSLAFNLADTPLNVSGFADFAPELALANPHLKHYIPFFFDRQLRGFVLCSEVQNFPYPHDNEVISLMQTLVSLTVMAMENQKLLAYRIRQEAMRKEIEIARQVQKMLFPKVLPDGERLKVYTTYLPHMDVSGDYYDFIPLSDTQFIICLADVAGKGMSAALLMSNFQACLRTLMMEKKPISEAIRLINSLVCQNSNLERFITAFVAGFDLETGLIEYVNSGHTPPCLIYPDGTLVNLSEGSPILGIFPELPHLRVGQSRIREEVFFVGYTDGLSEIENHQGEEFGSEGVENYMLENRHEHQMAVLHQRLLNRLSTFSGDIGFSDDITLLTARIRP